ncbi:MAG: hypothetical protein KDD50_15295, partial [Bdellovibrionales bacterium]|nr:hypothetical protein [Bdellovibrionales bacterium]
MEAFFDTPSSPKKGSQTSRPIKYHEIQSIVRMGLSAPTGDNAQHWRFTWNDQTLAIFYVKELGEHALNNNHHATYLSLGCLLESMSISASSFSLEVSYQLCTECEEDKPIALLTFNRSFKKTDPLVSEVLRRQTVRGALSREKMSAELKLLLDREVEKFENCRLAIYDEKDKQLLDYLLFCDELMWKNKKVSVDLLKWVRLSEKEISETRDGMPWQTLEVNTVERFMLRLFRVYPSVISLLWYLGFKFKINFLTKKAFR